jgi:phosphoribosylformylglycinamidine synthase
MEAMPTVRVIVTLKPSLLDSAGRTVADALHRMGYEEVQDARVGKVVELHLDQVDEARVKAMCDELLANPVIENFRYEVMS